jgi:hypothetical protein
MLGTFPSLIHSVFPRIPDSEYTVRRRFLSFLRPTFHIGSGRNRMANQRFQRRLARTGPIQVFTLPRNRESSRLPQASNYL